MYEYITGDNDPELPLDEYDLEAKLLIEKLLHHSARHVDIDTIAKWLIDIFQQTLEHTYTYDDVHDLSAKIHTTFYDG